MICLIILIKSKSSFFPSLCLSGVLLTFDLLPWPVTCSLAYSARSGCCHWKHAFLGKVCQFLCSILFLNLPGVPSRLKSSFLPPNLLILNLFRRQFQHSFFQVLTALTALEIIMALQKNRCYLLHLTRHQKNINISPPLGQTMSKSLCEAFSIH